MPSPDGSDLVAIITGEVVKQLPVRDALSPAASEIGGLGADLVKCVRLALAPVQYLAVQQDRYRRFIERSSQKVSDEARIEPALKFWVPSLREFDTNPSTRSPTRLSPNFSAVPSIESASVRHILLFQHCSGLCPKMSYA